MKIIDNIISKFIYFLAVCLLVFGLSTGFAVAHIDGFVECHCVPCTCQR
jgi:hypothetical protein